MISLVAMCLEFICLDQMCLYAWIGAHVAPAHLKGCRIIVREQCWRNPPKNLFWSNRQEWNLSQTLVEPSVEPFDTPEKPETPRNLEWNLNETLIKPWWNLPRNLLAAQDRSAKRKTRRGTIGNPRNKLMPARVPGPVEDQVEELGSPQALPHKRKKFATPRGPRPVREAMS